MLSLLLQSELVRLKPFCNRCFVSHALRVLLELCPPLLFKVILSLCILNDLLHPVVRFECRGEEVLGSEACGMLVDVDFGYGCIPIRHL